MMQHPNGALPPPTAPPPVNPTQHYGGVSAPPYAQPPVAAPGHAQWMTPPPHLQPPSYQPVPAVMTPPPQTWAPSQYSPAPAPAAAAAANPDEVRSLWIGNLQYWMDENYIFTCFLASGEVQSVKVIRNKQTNQSECYGFIEFANRAAAERALATFNGALMPQTEQTFRLNWATLGTGQKRQDDSPDHTLFVGDLAAEVTDLMLQEAFRAHYPSVKGAKVITDQTTGHSKGYGFVRFADENEQTRAMSELNGAMLLNRPMRLGPAANNKKPANVQQKAFQNTQGNPGENDPNSTTIFVGGLDPNALDDQLRQAFSPYGELVHVKVLVGRGYGFVQFANRASAEQALAALNGAQIGSQTVRLSWGRSPSAKQTQQGQTQWNNGAYYGYAQGYDAYGYAPAPQDPNMYYANYAAYGNYPQTQQ